MARKWGEGFNWDDGITLGASKQTPNTLLINIQIYYI